MQVFLVNKQKPKSVRGAFWVGFLAGVLLMALADVTDLHLCVGECDGKGISLSNLYEQPVSKTADRLPLGVTAPERR